MLLIPSVVLPKLLEQSSSAAKNGGGRKKKRQGLTGQPPDKGVQLYELGYKDFFFFLLPVVTSF